MVMADRAFLYQKMAQLRNKFNEDTDFLPPTPKQTSALARLIGEYDKDRDTKILMLRTITGIIRLQSSKQLTLKTISVLIDELKSEGKDWTLSENGKKILDDLARFIDDEPDPKRREERFQMWVKAHVKETNEKTG